MRHYSNNAVQTTLAGATTAAATTITVSAVTGFPAPDFVLALDYGTANQELVLVTNVAGTTLTVTRGYDNTTAVSHDIGAVVVHTHSAADFADSRDHEAATTNVHGVTGAVVGTTDTQVVTHKDLTDATNTFPTSLTTDAELSAHASATTGVHGVGTGAVVGTTGVQALTNKDLTDATNTFPTSLVTASGTQTLTNKTINLDNNTVTGGVWLSYLPTFDTWNIGSGTTVGNYRKDGHTVHWEVQITMGSGFTATGNLSLTLPPGMPPALSSRMPLGAASIVDSSANPRPLYVGTVCANNSTTAIILLNDTNLVSPTTPMTWGPGDILSIAGSYRTSA